MEEDKNQQIRLLRLNMQQVWEQLKWLEARLEKLEQGSPTADTSISSSQGPAEPPEFRAPASEGPPPPPVPAERPRIPEPHIPLPKPSIAKETSKQSELNPPTPTKHEAPCLDESEPSPLATKAGEPKQKENWEIDLGRVWFVRIGMLLFLTGLIFLSTYAYQNWLFSAAAGVKVSFFLCLALGLTAGGLLLERKKERYRQYGQVISGGGLAAAYYTLYAAHFTPSLKIITSPILAGSLLTTWAALMLVYSAFRRSRVVAVMAIGFAFYGTIVNPSGSISLFSALLLSSAAMYLLVRFQWVWIGLLTVVAAYLSHAFWLGYVGQATTETVRLTFLTCYWILFTLATSLPRARKLPENIQKTIIGINNAAAWSLTVFQIPSATPHEHIGWISLGIGGFWLALAAAGRWRSFGNPKLVTILALQGLMVATLGLIIEATGYARFTMLALEACFLLASARHLGGRYSRITSTLVFVLSLVSVAFAKIDNPEINVLLYGLFSLMVAAFAILARREADYLAVQGEMKRTDSLAIALMPALAFWIVFVVTVLGALEIQLAYVTGAAVLGAVILLGLGTKYGQFLKDILVTSAFFSAFGLMMANTHSAELGPLAYSALAAVALFHWFFSESLTALLRSDYLANPDAPLSNLDWIFSSIAWLLIAGGFGLYRDFDPHWIWTAGLLALSGEVFRQLSKRDSIGFPALLFHIVGLAALLDHPSVSLRICLTTPLLLVIHLAWIDRSAKYRVKSVTLSGLACLLMLSSTICLHRGLASPGLALILVAAPMIWWALKRDLAWAAAAAIIFPFGRGLAEIFDLSTADQFLPYLPVLSLLLAHALILKTPDRDSTSWRFTRGLALFLGLVVLVARASMHTTVAFEGSGLTVIWALLAVLLFCLGLSLKHRPYRFSGLALLVVALFHLVAVDVMKLNTLGRILSFMVLGLVLLLLGFLYNRFHEKIRQFL